MSPEEAEIRDGVTRMVCPNREALLVLLREIDRLRKQVAVLEVALSINPAKVAFRKYYSSLDTEEFS